MNKKKLISISMVLCCIILVSREHSMLMELLLFAVLLGGFIPEFIRSSYWKLQERILSILICSTTIFLKVIPIDLTFQYVGTMAMILAIIIVGNWIYKKVTNG